MGPIDDLYCTPCSTVGHSSPAVVRVKLNQGCAAFRDMREQSLCLQHLLSIEPIDDMELLQDFTDDQLFRTGRNPLRQAQTQ